MGTNTFSWRNKKNIFLITLSGAIYTNTVKPQWLELLWDHRTLVEIWVLRANVGLIMASGQEADEDI